MIGKNNPLNLRYVPYNHWTGQTGQTKGFCDFDNLEHGLRAVMKLVMVSYKKKGFVTLSQIISRYAPSTENDTQKYLDFVSDNTCIFPWDIPSTKGEWCDVFVQMSKIEGNPVSFELILSVYDRYFDKNKSK